MKYIKQYIQSHLKLSNYQYAVLEFFIKTILSESSKIVLMGLIFRKHLYMYFISLFIMLFLRCSTGGLHFYTYIGCLAMSIVYIGASILILPNIILPEYLKLTLLDFCVIICYRIGPVVSKYRPKPSNKVFTRGRNITCIFIFVYIIIQYIFPDSYSIRIGFWVIILHSFQLMIAKIRSKGGNPND